MAVNGRNVVLVTGVGGNVGQGILRVLRQTFPDFILVGTDIGRLTAGHHFCDVFHQVPYSYDPDYLQVMPRLCAQEQVDLVIPATDYEVLYLAKIADLLPPLIALPEDVARIFIDKLETFRAFASVGLSFARSWLPTQYGGECDEIIVKPREGRGSRGLHVNPPNPETFDETYMVQELLRGVEITTAFYVAGKNERRLHGMMTFERSLVSGMTDRCQLAPAHDAVLRPLIEGMIRHFAIVGPCNVQSIVTEDGRIVPFEVNGRFSGTTSIRAQLGFPDVVYGVQEFLLRQEPDPPQMRQSGSAIRIYMDIVYPDRDLDQIEAGEGDSFVF